MKRTFASTTFAFALLGMSACKGGTGDAIKYIPDGASVIGGSDLSALIGSKLYQDNKQMIEEGEGKEFLDAAQGCNLGKDKWKSVVFGADVKNADKKMAVVLSVDGIGKKENLECIGSKIKEKSDKDPWTLAEKDGRLTLEMDEGTGYVVGDNMLVIAGKDWTGSVKELIDGKGKAAVDGALKDVVARANTKEHFWLAGNVPEDMAQGPAAGLKNGVVTLNVSSGVAVDGSFGFGTAEEAKSKADEVSSQFDAMKGMAGDMVPQGVLDSVKIEAKDTAVHLSAKASDEEITKITQSVGQMMGGGMGGGMGGAGDMGGGIPDSPPPAEDAPADDEE